MPESFWNNTNSCMKYFKYTNDINEEQQPHRHCPGEKSGRACYASNTRLVNELLIFTDFRYINLNDDLNMYINKLNIFPRIQKFDSYITLIMRLFLNPSEDIMRRLMYFGRPFFNDKVLSIHIRTGGYLANFQERAYWLTQEELPHIGNWINELIVKQSLPRKIYLTTDSDNVMNYLKNNINATFVSNPHLIRSHSRDLRKDAFKGAIYDLFANALCSHHIITPHSGYSRLISYIADSSDTYKLNVKKKLYNTIFCVCYNNHYQHKFIVFYHLNSYSLFMIFMITILTKKILILRK